MKFTCPICGFDGLNYPPNNFSICPSCGTEFGYDDEQYSHTELREKWITNGKQWWSRSIPITSEISLLDNDSISPKLFSHANEGFQEVQFKKSGISNWMISGNSKIRFEGKYLPGKILSTSGENLKYTAICA